MNILDVCCLSETKTFELFSDFLAFTLSSKNSHQLGLNQPTDMFHHSTESWEHWEDDRTWAGALRTLWRLPKQRNILLPNLLATVVCLSLHNKIIHQPVTFSLHPFCDFKYFSLFASSWMYVRNWNLKYYKHLQAPPNCLIIICSNWMILLTSNPSLQSPKRPKIHNCLSISVIALLLKLLKPIWQISIHYLLPWWLTIVELHVPSLRRKLM